MSKTARFFHISLLFTALSTWSCSDPFTFWDDPVPGTLRLDMHLTWDGEPFGLGQTATDHNGHTIRLENLQFYLAELELRDASGNWQTLEDIHLVDFNNDEPFVLEEVPWGSWDAMRFGLGIPPDLNTGIDPASYPNDHPLSVAGSAGMFWTWASGYIFAKYEGKVAPEGVGEPIEPLSYHTGSDEAFRRVILEFSEPLYTSPRNLQTLHVNLDAAACLSGPADSIDVIADPITHSAIGTTLGNRVASLMANSFTVEQ